MSVPLLMKNVLPAALLAFAAIGNGVCADTDANLQRGVASFYRVYLETRPAGVPHARARAKFAPVISHSLLQLLERADAAERRYAKVTKKQVPPLAEGDIFTSLFEGAQQFDIKSCSRNTAATVCTVELRRDEADSQKSATVWSDKVYLLRSAGRWVVDDIEFGGNWPFMHKGRLRDRLRKIISDGNHARPLMR